MERGSASRIAIGFVCGIVVAGLAAIAIWPDQRGASPAETPAAAPKTTASKEETSSNTKPSEDMQEHLELCKKIGGYARSVMDNRQNGVPMSEAMDVIATATESVATAARQIIIEAYDYPRMSVEENKLSATTDFENKVYLECVKAGPSR